MIEVAELEPEAEVIEVETDEAEGVEAPEVEAESDDDDEVIVSIGDAPPPTEEAEPAPGWVKELRKANREKDKRIKELEAKLTVETKPTVSPPAKPKLSDFDYDEDAYDAARDKWDVQKREFDEAERNAKAAQEAEVNAWQERLTFYETSKKKLRVPDYDEAEAEARDLFNVTQQGIVVQGADNPALVIYAIGKTPSEAKRLAAITDPVKFAIAIGKLEMSLKVTKRNVTAPPPEKTVTGGAGTGGTVDNNLDRLREEAARTGDYSKVLKYKRQKQG